MDLALKNLREWVLILALLFISFDFAGIEYAGKLDASAAAVPDVATGEVASLVRGHRANRYLIYVTPKQRFVLIGLLGGAAAALVSLLGVIVVHGVRITALRRRQETATGAREVPPRRRVFGPRTFALFRRGHARTGSAYAAEKRPSRSRRAK